MFYNIEGKITECWLVEIEGIFFLIFLSTRGPFSNFSSGGEEGGEGGLEKQTSKVGQLRGRGGGGWGNPRACFMHFKLTNAGIPYLL